MSPSFAHSRHPRVDLADYEASFVTDTNSTVSGIPGLGRTMDVLLQRAGRQLEETVVDLRIITMLVRTQLWSNKSPRQAMSARLKEALSLLNQWSAHDSCNECDSHAFYMIDL
jgi:hypothetical protein